MRPFVRANELLVLASALGNEGAMEMRRLVGPMGGCGRQDISFAADDEKEAEPSSEEDDLEARAAYRKAEKELDRESRGARTAGRVWRQKR